MSKSFPIKLIQCEIIHRGVPFGGEITNLRESNWIQLGSGFALLAKVAVTV